MTASITQRGRGRRFSPRFSHTIAVGGCSSSRVCRAVCSGALDRRVFSLLMSLFVAVTVVPVLCSRLLVLPPPPTNARARGCLYSAIERSLNSMDWLRQLLHRASPTVGGRRMAFASSSWSLILPTLPTDLATQSDGARYGSTSIWHHGTRIESPPGASARGGCDHEYSQKTASSCGGGGGFVPGSVRWIGLAAPRELQIAPQAEDELTRFE